MPPKITHAVAERAGGLQHVGGFEGGWHGAGGLACPDFLSSRRAWRLARFFFSSRSRRRRSRRVNAGACPRLPLAWVALAAGAAAAACSRCRERTCAGRQLLLHLRAKHAPQDVGTCIVSISCSNI